MFLHDFTRNSGLVPPRCEKVVKMTMLVLGILKKGDQDDYVFGYRLDLGTRELTVHRYYGFFFSSVFWFGLVMVEL